ncbi:Protein detoxification 41 [Vitis vinifera]|uniref:Protein detoxification 41 n=1 Tax=Vitis vinifera TaxID=29760 RepID=A0A438HNA9_VITVI|nr:Protein detoxification 41 [Vitis vinifera]
MVSHCYLDTPPQESMNCHRQQWRSCCYTNQCLADGGLVCSGGSPASLGPLWFSNCSSVFNYMLSFITLMFAGQLGALELAGASIASVGIQGLAYGLWKRIIPSPTTSNEMDSLGHHHPVNQDMSDRKVEGSFSPSPTLMLGMASAVQTVCGQAYGAKKYAAMGIICQRAIVLHLGAAILLTFLYWYSGAFLKAIGQSESIAVQGQIFARGLILQVYAFALSCPMQRFLQAQNIVNPLAYIAVGPILQGNLDWLFFKSLPRNLALFQANCCFRCHVVSGDMVQPRSCAYIRPPPQPYSLTGLHSICMNYLNWDITFMLGLSAGASVRISNELGAAHPLVAKILSVSVNANSIIIRVAIGSGWQAIVAYVNLATYYLIGLPIGCVLGFKTSLGVVGIWWGMIVGVLLQTVVKAVDRIKKSSNEETLDLVLDKI